MSKIIIGGDILPTAMNEREFEKGALTSIFSDDLLSVLQTADYRIVNLEGCFTSGNSAILKSGPNIKASEMSFAGFSKLNLNLVCLANNHILDYGSEGFSSTLSLLRDHGISYCGAGANIREANHPFFFELGGKRIAVIALAEYEFTIATDSSPGAAFFDDLESPDLVSSTKKDVDFLIVLYHGGKEEYRYPTPYVQKRCRKLVEKGANLVITQHSHCIGCMERFDNGTIVYGQGNFLLSLHKENEFTQSGLLLELDTKDWSLKYHVLLRDGIGCRIASQDESERILKEFIKRSDDIQKEGFVKSNYEKFSLSLLHDYQMQSLGRVAVLLRKMHITGLLPKIYSLNSLADILNTMRCEAHRDVYICALERLLHTNEKNVTF